MSDHAGTDDGRMTLIEHLTELRRRILICVLAVAAASVVMFILFPSVLNFLEEPYREITRDAQRCGSDGCDLIATNPLAPFLVRIKVATYGGMALALPVVMWQIWRFVVPGLYPRERRLAIPFVLSTIVLFAAGVVVAWFSLEQALEFLLIDSVGGEIQPFVTADEYLTLVTLMMLAFGAGFELPVLLVFLMLAGVLSSAALRRARRWAVVGIAAGAAIITPSGDPISLLFLAVPVYLLYEAAILIGRLMRK